MVVRFDNPDVVPASAPDAFQTAHTLAAQTVGEKLSAALAHTSRATVLESRRQIEQVLGRKLEPRFALELVTLLLLPGSDGRELRAALIELLSMTDSPEWSPPSTRSASAMTTPDAEARFIASEEAACLQDIARCGECLARTAPELEGKSLTSEEAATLQWVLCAKCRCGTADWYQ